MLAAGTVMKDVFLGVGALETTAVIFRVGVYQTGRRHIAEFFQPMCAMTVPYFILYSVLRWLKDLLEYLKHCSYPGIFVAMDILEELWINLPTWCNIYCIISARHVSGLYAHLQEQVDVIISCIYSIWCPWCSGCRSWGECVLVVCIWCPWCSRCRSCGECVLVVCYCTSTHSPQDRHLLHQGRHMLYMQEIITSTCSWRWAYKPETCRADIIQ